MKCQGYEKRLSWPKSGDSKRALVGKPPPLVDDRSRSSDIHIIHTSFREMELHSTLTEWYSRSSPSFFRRELTNGLHQSRVDRLGENSA